MIAGLVRAREQIRQLVQAGEPSLAATVDDVFKKTLLLSAASYCESRLTEILLSLYESKCGGSVALSEFVRNQALGRKYHQLFNWEANNANQFFGLLGEDFKAHMLGKLKANSDYKNAEAAFLELGRLRNQAVHDNLAAFSLEKSVGEVLELYDRARSFLNIVDNEVRLCA